MCSSGLKSSQSQMEIETPSRIARLNIGGFAPSYEFRRKNRNICMTLL